MVKEENDLGNVLEKDINNVIKKSKQDPITIEKLLKSLEGRGSPFLVVILSLPFCQPLQIPGFSVPFGILVFFLGLRMAFGRRLWWPQWVLKKEVSAKLLEAIAQKSRWVMSKLSAIIRPRFSWMNQMPCMRVVNGLMIAGMGIFLALPLPIPLSNILAAWSIILIALGMIGNDGLLIGIGYLLGLICIGLIIFLVVISVHFLVHTT